MSIIVTIITLTISYCSTIGLAKDKWEILHLYVLLDNIFLAQVASAIGFISLLLVTFTGEWYQMSVLISFPFEVIFFVGNFRVMMLRVQWSKMRVIFFKIILLADAALFF
jgi:hypothetical protein